MFTLTHGAKVDLLESFGSILESAFFERLLHGKIRSGFVLGLGIMLLSGIMTVTWMMLYPDVHSNISMAGIFFCIGTAIIGSLVQTNTDIEDQEAGRYSKMGSGWNLWGDNIFFNKLGQFAQIIAIVCCFGASFYYFNESMYQKAQTKVASTTAKVSTSVASHAATHAPAHISSTSHHHKIEKKIHHQEQ